MAKQNRFFQNVRFVYQPSRPAIKLVVLAALILSMAALIGLNCARHYKKNQIAQMQAQAAQLKQDNLRLEQQIHQLGSVESIRHIAGEKLGLVDPDAVFFKPDSGNAN